MKRYKTLVYALCISAIGITMSQCVPYSVVDTSCATYKNPTVQSIDLSTSKTAILPVLAGGEWEGFRRPAGDQLYNALSNKYGRDKVLSPLQTLEIINTADLANKYSSLIETYQRAGILNKESLSEMGAALGSKYLIYTKIDNSEQFKSLKVGNNRYVNQINEVSIYTQCWDALKGDIVWEGIGGAAASSQAPASDVNSLINAAVNGLTKRLGVDPTQQPACQTTNAVVKQFTDNMMAYYWGIIGGSLIVSLLSLLVI